MSAPYYDRGGITIYHGDCREVLPTLSPSSAVVTDPPYGLEFMGKEWDKLGRDLPNAAALSGRRGYEDTKITEPDNPGGRHGSRFRGQHRRFRRCTKCGKREWSGSPCRCSDPEWKIETTKGATSSVLLMQEWHCRWAVEALRVAKPGAFLLAFGGTRTHHRLACAIEDAGWDIRDCIMWLYGSGFPKSHSISKAIDKAAGAERKTVGLSTVMARQWEGWGTALKPAYEPIIVAMNPLDGTFAQNAVRHGVAGLNIDGSRIEGAPPKVTGQGWEGSTGYGRGDDAPVQEFAQPAGRWPANVILDEDAAAALDEQSGELKSGANPTRRGADQSRFAFGEFGGQESCPAPRGADAGGASRFFYCSKAGRKDRGEGNDHPTVKPTDLMRYLCRLVAPPSGGVILDPFMGSGSTLVAAKDLGIKAVGIDIDERYCEIAANRLDRT